MTKEKRRKNLGFTLIEMITAFAVLGVAVIAIGGFFVSASRSYAGTSSETSLQYEAQLALNQIESMLLDSSLGVNYNVITSTSETSDGYNFVLNDSAITNPVSKVLYVFNVEGNAFNVTLLKWNAADKSIYYKKLPVDSAQTGVSQIDVKGISGWDLLAEGVENFSIDLSQYENTKNVHVDLSLNKKNKEYSTTGMITLRNDVLINQESLEKIYENISKIKTSLVDSVILTANSLVTVPGGVVQLSTKVVGVYPSQTIHRWIISSNADFSKPENIIYDSNTAEEGIINDNSKTRIDTAVKQLLVSTNVKDNTNTSFHETLFIKAMVNSVNEAGDPIEVYSDALCINVTDVKYLEIWPSDDKTAWNKVTSNNTEDEAKEQTADVYAGKILQMNYNIVGSDNTASQSEIIWTISHKSPQCLVNITQSGLVTIDKNSPKGEFVVTAALKVASEQYSVNYYFNIGSQWTEENRPQLTIDSIGELNRGGQHTCVLKLNGVEQNPLDYIWDISVANSAGQTINNAATIDNNGVIKVSDNLAFDYNFTIGVSATLKSDSDINTLALGTVPRVRLVINPTERKSSIGETIKAGRIICTVVGLETYNINWSMAKSTNPNYYFTAAGNSNISGADYDEGKTAVVVIGADEPAVLDYIRVKATLAGYSNYYTTMKLYFNENEGSGNNSGSESGSTEAPESGTTQAPTPETPSIPGGNATETKKLEIRGEKTINRGGTEKYTLWSTLNSWRGQDVTKNATWTVSATCGNIPLASTGLTISNGTLKVPVYYMLDSTYASQDITLKIRATYNGYYAEHEVTLNKVTFKMQYQNGNKYQDVTSSRITIKKNNLCNFKCSITGIDNISELKIQWELQDKNHNTLSNKDITLTKNSTTATVKVGRNIKNNVDCFLTVVLYDESGRNAVFSKEASLRCSSSSR